MAGVGDGDPVRDRVVHRVQAGGHAVRAEPLGLLVQVVQHLLRRQIEPGERLGGRPQLAHDRRGCHGVAHDVADHERHAAARQRDRVVPVAADTGGLCGRQIARRQPDTRRVRQGLGQHRPLQFVGDVRLTAVQHRLVDAERAVRGELRGDQQVVRLERQPVGRRRKSTAPMTLRRPRSGARIARWPAGTMVSSPSSSGSAARAAGASAKTGRTPRSTSASAPPGRTSHSSLLRATRPELSGTGTGRIRPPDPAPVGSGRCAAGAIRAARWAARRPRGADRADRRVSRRRRWHGGPAQPHHDLVEVDAASDPPGGGAHETQPVPVTPHGHGAVRHRALAGAPVLAAGGRHTVLLTAGLRRDALRNRARPVRARLLGGRL